MVCSICDLSHGPPVALQQGWDVPLENKAEDKGRNVQESRAFRPCFYDVGCCQPRTQQLTKRRRGAQNRLRVRLTGQLPRRREQEELGLAHRLPKDGVTLFKRQMRREQMDITTTRHLRAEFLGGACVTQNTWVVNNNDCSGLELRMLLGSWFHEPLDFRLPGHEEVAALVHSPAGTKEHRPCTTHMPV